MIDGVKLVCWYVLSIVLCSVRFFVQNMNDLCVRFVSGMVVWFFQCDLCGVMSYSGVCIIGSCLNVLGLIGFSSLLSFSLFDVSVVLIICVFCLNSFSLMFGQCCLYVVMIGVNSELLSGGMLIVSLLCLSVLRLFSFDCSCVCVVSMFWLCWNMICLVLVSIICWLLCSNSGELILFFSVFIILLMVGCVMNSLLVVVVKFC